MATKPDRTRHPADGLSVAQQHAVDCLVLGASDTEAAAAGVTRPTVCDWRNHHPAFRAQLNEARSALWTSAHDQLRSLIPVAVGILAASLAERPDPKVALDVLRLAGLGEGGHLGAVGVGPTTVEAIEAADADARDRAVMADLLRPDVSHLPRGRWHG